ncbi:MAG TPA: hypothetical protein VEV13_08105 [Candidatus Limnocylindria bacterium]|nr:hypothetical protein [Candidatus Limnocylindria bacterium]
MRRSMGTVEQVLARLPGGPELLESIAVALDATPLALIHVQSLRVRDTVDGSRLDLAVLVPGTTAFAVPFLPELTLTLNETEPGWTALRGSVTLGPSGRLDVPLLTATVRLDTPLLRRVDPPGPVEATIGGSLSIGRNLDVAAAVDGFDLPDFTIAGTGLTVGLSACRLVLEGGDLPPPLAGLDLDVGFRGVHAAQGTLHWLPQAVLAGVPGLHVELSDVAVGTGGASFDLDATFRLDVDGQHVLPTSEVAGHLLDGAVELGIGRVVAQVRGTVPTAFSVTGAVRLPFLDTVFDTELGLQADADGPVAALSLSQRDAATLDLGAGTLVVTGLQVDGTLGPDAFTVDGSFSGWLDLAPLALSLQAAQVRVEHTAQHDLLDCRLDGLDLGPLGEVETASLRIASRLGPDGTQATSVVLTATYRWADLAARLDLASLPAQFPLPPDDGVVEAFVSWEDDGAGAHQMVVRFAAEVQDPDSLWRSIPPDLRPAVEQFTFTAEVRYASTAAFDDADTDGAFSARLTGELALRLPPLDDLPGAALVRVRTGGADGVLRATLEAAVDDAGTPSLSMTMTDLLTLDVDLPGLAQPEPFLHAELTSVGVDLSAATDTTGAFAFAGSFVVRPIDPPVPAPLASHLSRLFDAVTVTDLVGTVEAALRVEDAQAQFTLDGTFTSADVDIDLFGLLGGLASGLGVPVGADEPRGEAALDIEVGIGLRGVGVRLGSLDAPGGGGAGTAESAALELRAELRLAGLAVPAVVRLSDRELSLGLDSVDIPLRPPTFPVTAADLNGLTTDQAWAGRLADLTAQIAALPMTAQGAADGVRLAGQLALLTQVFAIRQRLSPQSRAGFEDGVGLVVGALDAMSGLVTPASDIAFALRDVRFVVPFADPRDLGVEGGGHLTGFAPGDPFAALEGLRLGLGVSADTVFFSVENVGTPIPLPDLGRYPGGSVDLSRLTLGYGFTRNSFSMAFRGELTLPQQLVEDADTSDVVGAGIRLPEHSRLGFRFDLIPIPGPVPVVPLLEFDLDLRSPGAPALVAGQRCEPFWDGLQVQVPGVVQASLKHLAIAPTFGILPIPNLRFDGDLVVGTPSSGVTLVVDDLLVMVGLYSGGATIPLPFLADPYWPYFENICLGVQVAGFGVSAHLQRPFPSPSPMVLFEVLGLISDPMMPIDPQGDLARSVRVTLVDARITVPDAARAVFPDVVGVLEKPVRAELNAGQLVTGVQAVVAAVGPALDAVEAAGEDLEQAVRELAAHPPEVRVGDILAALPPELRKIRTGGSFAGFEARAVLLLIDAGDLAALQREFTLRDAPPGPPVVPHLELGLTPDPAEVAAYRPNLPPRPSAGRVVHLDDPANSLVAGLEFAAFTTADLAEIPAHRDAASPRRPVPAGVVVAAHVSVFRRQRFRFLGHLFEDGSFGLVSALDLPPLRLTVAGIPVELPLEVTGRFVLQGRAHRDGFHGSVTASVSAVWNVAAGLVRVELGLAGKPVRAELRSDGTFAVAGGGRLLLFNSAVEVVGRIDVSHTHCLVEGSFDWRTTALVGGHPVLELALDVSGRVGPGRTIALAGSGGLTVLGTPLLDVEGTLDERGAAVSARLDTGTWRVDGTNVTCRVELALRGEINLARRAVPRALLEGEGRIVAFGAEVTGRGGIRAAGGALTTYVEGTLRWHGRDWISGRVELGAAGIALSGRASLTIALTPNNLAGTDLAHLLFQLDLSAGFSFDAAGGLRSVRLAGGWTLGARAPGTGQLFPLAGQRVDLDATGTFQLPLISVDAFAVLPFGDLSSVTVPVPVLSPSSTPAPIAFGTGPLLGVPAIGFRWGGLGIGGDVLAAPGGEVVGELPLAFKVDVEDVEITLPIDLAASFAVALVWHQGRLQLKVTRAGTAAQYVSL